ncbi:MAG: ABC transporter ATP-binding protein [Merismopedia sp. SIO2A8]|nr:ABC transporter ATP-binding protein [Symploca sp. SIO2B6]NET51526.1 ABC transporter ATP-binding protein [Merismopedia sp. SIO2A8]
MESQALTGGYGEESIVQNISFALQPGEWLSILGANGSGKSTLLRLLSRILSPQQGTVLLDGKSIHTQSAQTIAQTLALLPQQQTIPPGLSVRQLVSLGRAPHQPWWRWELNAEDHEQVTLALESTGLVKYGDRSLEQLSGGERQRAFLALALAQAPQVLLLDEPTTYLDLRYQLELLELLKHLNDHQNIAIITVLHEVNLAARFSDRLALLKQGNLCHLGVPTEVLTPEHIAAIFNIHAAIVQTPVGIQICPLTPISSRS